MEKAKVLSSAEAMIERAKHGDGVIVDGATLVNSMTKLLKSLDTLAGCLNKGFEETPDDQIPALALTGGALDLFMEIFDAAKELKGVLMAHGKALKEHREGPGGGSVPSPTVEGSGRA